ncbi:hypothetical protein OUZ56_018448 [Daphnia magna]|uniref:Uncharacterized protein n=1 Tax=Daphnia magna TaxID=35525 RepID=A0ABQ9Z8V4_9CRUS|nr:hypothetical protein OUZ56_018448 [Daphnia magna]
MFDVMALKSSLVLNNGPKYSHLLEQTYHKGFGFVRAVVVTVVICLGEPIRMPESLADGEMAEDIRDLDPEY